MLLMVGSWDNATCHTLTVPEAGKSRRPKIDGHQSFAKVRQAMAHEPFWDCNSSW